MVVNERIVVEIPGLPAPELSPNYRGHWSRKARATRDFRQLGFVAAKEACHFEPPYYDKALLRITFVAPSRAYIRDDDNAVSSIKPALDGCVDAEIIKDDSPRHLRILQVVWNIDKHKEKETILEFIKQEAP